MPRPKSIVNSQYYTAQTLNIHHIIESLMPFEPLLPFRVFMVFIWCLILLGCAVAYSHCRLHILSFTPLCFFICILVSLVGSGYIHLVACKRPFSTVYLHCVLRLFAWKAAYSDWLHLWDLSPSCFCTFFLRLPVNVKALAQKFFIAGRFLIFPQISQLNRSICTLITFESFLATVCFQM